MEKVLKIGNAQAFWGDSPGAPARLVQQQPDLDYLTLDYLSEVSMSIMAIQKEKDPLAGYAQDFIDVVRSLVPFWKNGSKVKVICNAGGLNPLGCAQACADVLQKIGVKLNIGVVSGDNVLDVLLEGDHLETGESLSAVRDRLVTANAYLGARPITEALSKGADLVITGRVADPSLTVGPCMHHFGWDEKAYDKIAGATVAGHLIECGTQVTGGISTQWLEIEDPAHIGFPVVEISEDGTFVITKPPGTRGKVNEQTVKEQLLYEIGDPDRYISPDAIVSFLSLKLTPDGADRIFLSGAVGKPPPLTYKVSATYRNGFKAEGMIAFFGKDAVKKARKCGEIVLQRVKDAGYILQKASIECLGSGDIVPGVFGEKTDLLECILRICIADERKEAVEFFTKEIAPLVTSGPQGVCGYTSGRSHVRPVFGYWPCLIPTELVSPIIHMRNL